MKSYNNIGSFQEVRYNGTPSFLFIFNNSEKQVVYSDLKQLVSKLRVDGYNNIRVEKSEKPIKSISYVDRKCRGGIVYGDLKGE